MSSIRIRVVLFILISGLIPLFLVGWFIHGYASEMLVKQHSSDLTNLAKSQAHILESHISHITEDAELLAKNDGVRTYLSELASGDVSDVSFAYAGRAVAQLQDIRWGDIHHVMICDTSGRVVISPPPRLME